MTFGNTFKVSFLMWQKIEVKEEPTGKDSSPEVKGVASRETLSPNYFGDTVTPLTWPWPLDDKGSHNKGWGASDSGG